MPYRELRRRELIEPAPRVPRRHVLPVLGLRPLLLHRLRRMLYSRLLYHRRRGFRGRVMEWRGLSGSRRLGLAEADKGGFSHLRGDGEACLFRRRLRRGVVEGRRRLLQSLRFRLAEGHAIRYFRHGGGEELVHRRLWWGVVEGGDLRIPGKYLRIVGRIYKLKLLRQKTRNILLVIQLFHNI